MMISQIWSQEQTSRTRLSKKLIDDSQRGISIPTTSSLFFLEEWAAIACRVCAGNHGNFIGVGFCMIIPGQRRSVVIGLLACKKSHSAFLPTIGHLDWDLW